ncbi:MAG TPA: iron-containing alcohol dehydrogenase, partial [Candidatus Cloacimonadota bacterium]|nr:iron-containing alcohol dehydrogenase [Candidatus Cloacimonadota bacterium]
MEAFTFYNPTRISFGVGTIKNLGMELSKAGIKKILLIAGGGSIKQNGVYNQVLDSLTKSGIQSVEAWGVQANPILSKARDIVSLAKESEVSAVLAVGGGSV